MPAIKKRITAEYLEREQQRSEQNGRGGGDGDEEALPAAPPPASMPGSSPLKRKASSGTHLLKGLDGEVLVEKRKRTLPPAELKLDGWLDENLEKKSESTLSVKKLYQFYTDMCQQDATNVLEMEIFRQNLRNKFGKEFGLKDNSTYNGLLKESKPRKKPVVAPSLGYKLKDLIQEALKASGSPSKGVMFAWVKKFIAAKYPALQIELKPHFLRTALQREIYAGKVELVKGIGFCGFYRLPGPSEVEEESSKSKKKSTKKTAKEEESAESVDDTADKDGEQSDKSQEKTDESSSEPKEQKKKEGEDSVDEAEGKEEKKGEENKDQKKAKKKKKRPSKPRPLNGPRHSNPQTINDIFPLAMTYMAEPKEASFSRIRKYLDKYYGKSDIDIKLKRCLEHGCETGMWERVSGSGASGSFQLQVDSFNPEHTESLTDMVCSAIIACTEPKISSVRLLKSYISEYHPEFNIDTRPIKLRNALERAEKHNQLRRISGIGMSGSFQLVEQFMPSPSVLAGEDEEEEEDTDYAAGAGKEEVYVVRQTKSGRRAPIEKTQVDFSSTYKRRMPSSAPRNKVSSSKRKRAPQKRKSVESSSEEEESSDEAEDKVAQDMGYKPRPTKSRGGSAAAATKRSMAKAAPPARPKPPTAKGKKASRPTVKQDTAPSPAKKNKPTPARSPRRPTSKGVHYREEEEEEEEEEEKDTYTPPPPPSPKKMTPAKKTAIRRGRASKVEESEEEEEENYYEVEEVTTPKTPPSAKRGRAGAGKAAAGSNKKQTPPSSSRKGARKETAPPSPQPEVRTPRSASKYARKSLKEMESEDEEEEEYVARPTTSRGGKKR